MPLRSFVLVAALALASSAHAASYTYLAEQSPLMYLDGVDFPPAAWAAPGADTARFVNSSAGFGIGYGDDDDRTTLSDMRNRYLTVYVRARFFVGPELESLTRLVLAARYDDGFVAYLNGVEVARAGLPAGAVGPGTAAESHEAAQPEQVFALDRARLVPGENVFAVEVHNTAVGSTDLSFVPRLVGLDAAEPEAALAAPPYLQQVSRRGMTVCWETDRPAPSKVLYGPTPDLGRVAEDSTPRTRHKLALTGLEPGTRTYYQVVSVSPAGAPLSAATEPDRAAPLRLLAYGDTRSDPDAHSMVIRRAAAELPQIALHSGDLIEMSTVENWRTFFGVANPLLSSTGLLTAIGNHELEGDPNVAQYLDYFALPDDAGTERYYVRRFGSVAVVAIDQYSTYANGTPQYQWLDRTLAALMADPDVRFTFVVAHMAPYSSGYHGGDEVTRRDLVPLFERHGVDVMFAGHDHHYERYTVNGVKYVITGGGGGPLGAASPSSFTEALAVAYHYCLVDVYGASATFRAMKADDGTLIDQFTLGAGVEECAAPADCNSRPAGTCAAEDEGEWECVAKACIWNCRAPALPQPDAGAPAPTPDASPAEDPGASPQTPPDDGCGCSTAGVAPLAAAAMIAAAAGLGRRRREGPRSAR